MAKKLRSRFFIDENIKDRQKISVQLRYLVIRSICSETLIRVEYKRPIYIPTVFFSQRVFHSKKRDSYLSLQNR